MMGLLARRSKTFAEIIDSHPAISPPAVRGETRKLERAAEQWQAADWPPQPAKPPTCLASPSALAYPVGPAWRTAAIAQD